MEKNVALYAQGWSFQFRYVERSLLRLLVRNIKNLVPPITCASSFSWWVFASFEVWYL